jgi:hypothetical protein
MTALRLIVGEGRPAEAGVAAISLGERSRRPGLAHEELGLELDRPTAVHVGRHAARERLPVALWAVIAIESERALFAVAPGDGARMKLIEHLDAVAGDTAEATLPNTRLDAYAYALRGSYVAAPSAPLTRLSLLVPYHSLRAWQIAADCDEIALDEWARRGLLAARPGRASWEAAAALCGQTLGEWIALGSP